jgi:hypothetical protein
VPLSSPLLSHLRSPRSSCWLITENAQ